MLNGAWYAQQFRDLADDFAGLVRDAPVRAEEIRAAAARQLELRDCGGGLLIEAIRHGVLLGVPGLQERVEWHTSHDDDSQVGPARLQRSPANLFWEVCGNHVLPVKNDGGTLILLAPEPTGVLPTAFPNLLPPPRCVMVPAASDAERQKLQRFIAQYSLSNFARACRLLAEQADSPGDGPVLLDDLHRQRTPTFLGLLINRDLRTVGRNGLDVAPVSLTGREWEMFLILYEARGEEVPTSRFKPPKYAGSSKGQALRGIKNELASKLERLNLDLSDWSIKDCRKT